MTKAELGEKLTKLGYSVETKGETILVKLPLFCSVSVSLSDDTLKCDARFGFVGRTLATWLNCLIVPYIFLYISWTIKANNLYIAFIGISILLIGIWEVFRYILTQSFINLVQQIWIFNST